MILEIMSSVLEVILQTPMYYMGIFMFDQQFEMLIGVTEFSLKLVHPYRSCPNKQAPPKELLHAEIALRDCACAFSFFAFHKTQSFLDLRRQKDCTQSNDTDEGFYFGENNIIILPI